MQNTDHVTVLRKGVGLSASGFDNSYVFLKHTVRACLPLAQYTNAHMHIDSLTVLAGYQ